MFLEVTAKKVHHKFPYQVIKPGGGHLILKSVTMRVLKKNRKKDSFWKTMSRNVRSMFRVSTLAFWPNRVSKMEKTLLSNQKVGISKIRQINQSYGQKTRTSQSLKTVVQKYVSLKRVSF